MVEAVEIRRLSERELFGSFSCGHDALDAFLLKYAKQQQKRQQSATSVAIVAGEVAGFVTVLPGAIDPGRISSLVKGMPRQAVPVLVLARMGTDPRFKHLGIGRCLLRDVVFERAETLARDFGCLGVLVDSKNGADGFYARFGFVAVDEPGATSTPMFLPMSTLRSATAR